MSAERHSQSSGTTPNGSPAHSQRPQLPARQRRVRGKSPERWRLRPEKNEQFVAAGARRGSHRTNGRSPLNCVHHHSARAAPIALKGEIGETPRKASASTSGTLSRVLTSQAAAGRLQFYHSAAIAGIARGGGGGGGGGGAGGGAPGGGGGGLGGGPNAVSNRACRARMPPAC